MSETKPMDFTEITPKICQFLMENYWGKIWKLLEENPHLKEGFTSLLLNPEKLILYFGKTHWAIEYVGEVRKDELESTGNLQVEIKDYTFSDNLLDEIIGIDFSEQTGPRLPLAEYNQDVFYPTNSASEILAANGWNFAAQSMIFGINSGGVYIPNNRGSRIINSFFYGTDNQGLVVRNIKWLDVLPLEIVDVDNETEQFNIKFWNNLEEKSIEDVQFRYPMPEGYQYEKLPQLNRFVELISSEKTSETEITQFLSAPENQFILKMAFFGKGIHPEKECAWQSEPDRKHIRPDFFVTAPNGFSDIVEFKLPNLKGKAVVGKENRETFSAEIRSYIAQTCVYEEYFEDPNNRKYVQEKYGIDVRYPKRILVMGRRWMFDSTEWRKIENDGRNITIRTFDDIIDGVLSHLYL
ncbi:Shedu anti-phage system protein SduA domain-containing protein [Bacillus cereus]|uniref:Shedu anti-phage system protein SduA domain-containing protein n=1 Tax=Bacillus cereus TaxID=1396 RepID=UPI000BF7ED80|nr:Shedu anti-phage system protein SduA domain-containing protein [Bacillus cereus]PFB62837.1 hypothetical protein CN291_20500 [Bacillus cereus]